AAENVTQNLITGPSLCHFGTAEEKIGTAEEVFGTPEGFAGWAAAKIRTAAESFELLAVAEPVAAIDAPWRRFTSSTVSKIRSKNFSQRDPFDSERSKSGVIRSTTCTP
ncbi:MAG: hypothetical protein RLZZ245_2289, partial [Verrucomicrobiota bacterium]